jgi:hypothetical protein
MAQHWVNEQRFFGRHDCMDNKTPNRTAKQALHYFLGDFFDIAVKKSTRLHGNGAALGERTAFFWQT